MRKTLVSLSLIVATGSTLVAGGAFSVFNDTKTATGTYTTGSVSLGLGANTLTVTGCTPAFTGASTNMGSVNNNVCTSTLTVTNKGTLPMALVLPGTTVSDLITTIIAGGGVPATVNGKACFHSAIVSALPSPSIAPGASSTVSITTTVNTDNACQKLNDKVTATLQANESLPS